MIIFLLIPIAYGIEECQRIIEPTDIPCRITTTWEYPLGCGNYTTIIYSEEGTQLNLMNLSSFGNTGFCNFTFNYTEKGSYIYNISSGDTGGILVQVDKMNMSIILGIGIICAVFLFFILKLENEHFLLKYFLIFEIITMLSIIPSVFTINDPSLIFHKAYTRFLIVFWFYVGTFFFYKIMVKLGLIIPKEGNNNGE